MAQNKRIKTQKLIHPLFYYYNFIIVISVVFVALKTQKANLK